MGHIHELIDFIVNAYIIHDDKILLIKHKKLNLWLPIGGHIELDEDPEQALYREIKEECGLQIELFNKTKGISDDDCKFIPLPNFLDIHKISDTHKHVAFEYIALAKNKDVKFNQDEHTDFGWFSESELNKLELKSNVLYLTKEALRIARNSQLEIRN